MLVSLIMPAQEMARITMESVARCDRMRGELDDRCWATLSSCSEAVQFKVFEDINNAMSKPDWRLANLSAWTTKNIHRQLDTMKTLPTMPYWQLAPSVQVLFLTSLASAVDVVHDSSFIFLLAPIGSSI